MATLVFQRGNTAHGPNHLWRSTIQNGNSTGVIAAVFKTLQAIDQEPPAQNVVGPLGVIVAVSGVLTVTAVSADVALQPFASVTVTW